jgi:hypothetical protein
MYFSFGFSIRDAPLGLTDPSIYALCVYSERWLLRDPFVDARGI